MIFLIDLYLPEFTVFAIDVPQQLAPLALPIAFIRRQ